MCSHLYAETLDETQGWLEINPDKLTMAKQFFVDRAINDAAFILERIDKRWPAIVNSFAAKELYLSDVCGDSKYPYAPSLSRRLPVRKLIILLLLCFSFLGANAQAPPSNMDVFDGCSMDGSAKTGNLKKLNQLKNRYGAPQDSQIDHSITLSAMLAPGDDKTRWSSTSGAEVTGFVLDVKPGGGETCNCGKTDASHTDSHIELVLHTSDTAMTQSVVVEVTPRLQAILSASGTDWSTKALRKQILHKWIKVRGWMTFDSQHANAAENTNPGGTSNWRATAWEIHPVTDIQVVAAPQ